MKLANCPFYLLGCESAFPACNLGSHCAQFVRTHLRLLLDRNQITTMADRQELDLEERLALLEKVCSSILISSDSLLKIWGSSTGKLIPIYDASV
jgi:homogentisate solanesyltransferase